MRSYCLRALRVYKFRCRYRHELSLHNEIKWRTGGSRKVLSGSTLSLGDIDCQSSLIIDCGLL